jgi:hypothetical protein
LKTIDRRDYSYPEMTTRTGRKLWVDGLRSRIAVRKKVIVSHLNTQRKIYRLPSFGSPAFGKTFLISNLIH